MYEITIALKEIGEGELLEVLQLVATVIDPYSLTWIIEIWANQETED